MMAIEGPQTDSDKKSKSGTHQDAVEKLAKRDVPTQEEATFDINLVPEGSPPRRALTPLT